MKFIILESYECIKLNWATECKTPGTQDYKDNFYEADQDLTGLKKRVAKKYGLTQDEIDSLDSMLETPKNVY